ncbi:hypothetical protein [Halapricum hydrolyticum]|uniref:Uncharacterized protein n=1 Tax=Halapricum hydrolyticum TaxID=2979991 RepID=A0AAE3IFA8_9EURY|nr:hypothetical protein [Halapricum hydrolyticum]MCU4719120.1 hypothetical protein [Halapricum hydrolyticum]MCU4727310.1 hypothetical protein [Halapricum hydrolyticum]
MAPTDIILNEDEVDVDAATINIRSTRGDTEDQRTIRIDTQYGDVTAGGNGTHGTLSLTNGSGTEQIRAGAGENLGTLSLGSAEDGVSTRSVLFHSDGFGRVGGDGETGRFNLNDSAGNIIISAEAGDQTLTLRSRQEETNIELDARRATLWVGSDGETDGAASGTIRLRRKADEETVRINGSLPTQYFYQDGERTLTLQGQTATYEAGNPNEDGAVELQSAEFDSGGHNEVRLDAEDARLTMAVEDDAGETRQPVHLTSKADLKLGAEQTPGNVQVAETDGTPRLEFAGASDAARQNSAISDTVRLYANASTGSVVLGGNDRAGSLRLLDFADRQVGVLTNGQLSLGGGTQTDPGPPGTLTVSNQSGSVMGTLSGHDGSLELGGAMGGNRDKKKDGTSSSEPGESGTVSVKHEDGTEKVAIESDPRASVTMYNDDGTAAGTIQAAPSGQSLVMDSGGQSMVLDGDNGWAVLGGSNPSQVTGAERFGVRSESSGFGGMYIDSTDTSRGMPFYGYSIDGSARAYHYFDESDQEWILSMPAGTVRIEADGTINAPSKNFVHPVANEDGDKDVVYTATESAVPRTEASGLAELQNGSAVVELPEHFRWVTSDEEPLLVQVTAHSKNEVQPQVTERSTERIVIEDVGSDAVDYEVSYTVRGTRDGHEDKEVIRDASARDSPDTAG